MTSTPTLDEIYQDVEGDDLSFQANLAPGMRRFQEIVQNSTGFKLVLEALESPEAEARIIARLKALALSEIDPDFENPHDVAMATYAAALATRDLAGVAASVSVGAKNTWWLRRMLRNLPYGVERFASDPDTSGSTIINETREASNNTPLSTSEPLVFGGRDVLVIRQSSDPPVDTWALSGSES
jgi:hypothetical protein